MKSRTSSCKGALGKDLSRFWPVWAGYILCLVFLQIMQSNNDLSYWYAANIAECISVMGVVNAAYALVVAQMLFGDLFQPRMALGLHALPLKRQTWYSAHIAAGFLFSLLPTAVMAGFSEILIARYSVMVSGWQLPLYWFAASNLQYVFFFGLAVFSAMCSGSRFAMAAVYAILNFCSALIYLLVDQLYAPLLYGVVTMSTVFEILCPVVRLVTLPCIDCDRVETGRLYTDARGVEQKEIIGTFTLVKEGWMYTFALAAIGIALLLLARKLYKRRHLERAGDFMAVRWLNPVFQVVFSVLCAAIFHGICTLFLGIQIESLHLTTYLLPAIGLTAGWFGGRMLLEKTTRIFRLKTFAGFAALAILMAGSLYLTHLDPLGIETWVPTPGEVQSANVRINYRNGYTTEEAAEIEEIARLHELALQQRVQVHPDYDDTFFSPTNRDPRAVRITVQYINHRGLPIQRSYHVLAEGESGELVRKYTSRLDVLLPDLDTPEAVRREIQAAELVYVGGCAVPEKFVTEEFLADLAEAFIADTEAGKMVQSGVFHPEPILEAPEETEDLYYLTFDVYGVRFWGSLYIYADCENILSVLEPTGILETVRGRYFEQRY